jgi:PilZ domain
VFVRRGARRIEEQHPALEERTQELSSALVGMVRYLSEGGLMVEFPVELLQGTRVRVVLPTFQGPLEVEGEIVWTAPTGASFGTAWPSPSPKDPTSSRGCSGKTAEPPPRAKPPPVWTGLGVLLPSRS